MKKTAAFIIILLLISGYAFSIRKGEKIILDQLNHIEKLLKKMNDELSMVSSDISSIFKKIIIIENKVNAFTKAKADNSLKNENLYDNILIFKQDIGDIKRRLNELTQLLMNKKSDKIETSQYPANNDTNIDNSATSQADDKSPNLYFIAYSDYINKNYNLAIKGFEKFISYYPNTLRAKKALYWIGECYYAQRRYEKAIEIFDRLLSQHGDGANVSDALLKKGYALIAMGRHMEGKKVLTRLISKYPFSEISSLAKQKLKEISE